MTTTKEIQAKLDTIDEQGVGLTDSEIEFIDSMLKESDKPVPVFTSKQKETIDKIYSERVSR